MEAKNKYRLKLEIKLKYIDKGINQENYILIIKVLKKDKRFDVYPDLCTNDSKVNINYIYTASNEFTILTNSLNKYGDIGSFNFIIPNKKYLNRRIVASFLNDAARKTYLRHLHKALMEWSNNWDSFSKESPTKFKALGNKWYFYITR